MTNFGFLNEKEQYDSFTSACLEAEKSLQISPATTAILSRRALELAVKWTYSFDDGLKLPYDDRLSALIHEQTFRDIIDSDLFPLIRYIVKLGNVAVHTNSNISRDEAITSLRNLHEFVSWIDYCYSVDYTAQAFNEELLLDGGETRKRKEEYQDLFEKLDRKSTRLNSSHVAISYAVYCLKFKQYKLHLIITYVTTHTIFPYTTLFRSSRDEAITSLRNLHEFVSWIDYCYSVDYTAQAFNEELLLDGGETRKRKEEYQDLFEKLSAKDRKLEDIISENEKLRKQVTETRIHNQEKKDYDFKVDEISEYETRQRYIDVDLKLAGWTFNKDVSIEYEVKGMPNAKGIGYVDYVLFGDNGKPLALIEAKRTSVDVNQGKQQAKLYADCLENMHDQRPIIFLTNGFESRIWDDMEYPDRNVSGIYSKPDLVKLIERRQPKHPLQNIIIKEDRKS